MAIPPALVPHLVFAPLQAVPEEKPGDTPAEKASTSGASGAAGQQDQLAGSKQADSKQDQQEASSRHGGSIQSARERDRRGREALQALQLKSVVWYAMSVLCSCSGMRCRIAMWEQF